MNKRIFVLILMSLFFFTKSYCQLKKISGPNLYSEVEIFKDNMGNWYSTSLTIKFAKKTIDLLPEIRDANIDDIQIPGTKKLFSSIENKFGKIKLKKVFVNSFWGDTVGTNIVTKQKVKLKDLSQFFEIRFNHIICVDSLINDLLKSPHIEYAERPFIAMNIYEPSDYNGVEQWSLSKIDAPNAWEITRGSDAVKIGISDEFTSTNINELHNELRNGKIAYNPNNYCRSHGQSVAGCASALTDNNSNSIASIGFNTRLMFAWKSANGINELRLNGAHIINCSWIQHYGYGLESVIFNVLQEGRIITAGIGNDPVSFAKQLGESVPFVVYPAAYNFPSIGRQVIAVSATSLIGGTEYFGNPQDGLWNYSPGNDPNNDPTNSFVDFSAPGVGIKILDYNLIDGYVTGQGTSLAAPTVAGLLGLIKSIYSDLSPETAYTILKNSSEKVGNDSYNSIGWNQYLGYGRINAYKALKYTIEHYGGTFNQDIIIPAGDSWNIQSGLTLSFEYGKKLIVKGTLNATNVTFTSTTSGITWSGIKFENSSNGNLDGCIIKEVNNGGAAITITDANPVIKNSTIKNLWISTDGIHIFNCTYRKPFINNNVIQDGDDAIYMYNSTAYITENDLTGDYDLLTMNYYSNAYFYTPSSQSALGNNYIHGGQYGLKPNYYSLIIAGLGNNAGAHNNNFSNGLYNAHVTNNSTLVARQNSWSPTPPSKIYTDGSSYVFYDQYLSKINSEFNYLNDLVTSQSLRQDKQYSESFKMLISIVDKNINSGNLGTVYSEMSQLYYESNDQRIIDFLENIRSDKSNCCRAEVLEILSNIYFSNNNELKQREVVEELLKDFKKTIHEKNGLISEFFLNYKKGDIQKAKESFAKIDGKYKNDKEIKFVEQILNLAYENILKKDTQNNRLTLTPSEFNLIGNFPNPFNPTTLINYSIPVNSNVKITIYDIMGSLIKSFDFNSQSSGYHKVEWNGTNENGIKVSSGTYIYRMEAISTEGIADRFVQSKKMVLIK